MYHLCFKNKNIRNCAGFFFFHSLVQILTPLKYMSKIPLKIQNYIATVAPIFISLEM